MIYSLILITNKSLTDLTQKEQLYDINTNYYPRATNTCIRKLKYICV